MRFLHAGLFQLSYVPVFDTAHEIHQLPPSPPRYGSKEVLGAEALAVIDCGHKWIPRGFPGVCASIPSSPVDALAHQVHVARVASRFLEHVDQYPPEADMLPESGGPDTERLQR